MFDCVHARLLCMVLQASAALQDDPAVAAAPDSAQHDSTASSSSSSSSQSLQAANTDPAANVRTAAAGASTAQLQAELLQPGAAGGDVADHQHFEADLTTAHIDVHSLGWQLVMRELMAWAQQKKEQVQQQQQHEVVHKTVSNVKLLVSSGQLPLNTQQVCCAANS
jgi:hypothetical protein